MNSNLAETPSYNNKLSIAKYAKNELSIPMFPVVTGPRWYRDKLRTFSTNLRDDLLLKRRKIETSRSYDLTIALELIIHSLAHVASNPATLEYVAMSRNQNDYRPGSAYRGIGFTSLMLAVDLLKDTLILDGGLGYKLCTFRNGWRDRTLNKGARSRLRACRPLEDMMTKAGLIWETHPYDPKPANLSGILFLGLQWPT